MIQNAPPQFSLGQVLATPGALEAMRASGQSESEFLSRHAQGDWGELSVDDRQLNDNAVGDSACSSCVQSCSECGDSLCTGCQTPCASCDAILCSSCQTENRCKACHDEVETESTDDSGGLAGAEVQPVGLGEAPVPA